MNKHPDTAARAEHPPQYTGATTEIQGQRKRAANIIQAISQPVSDLSQEEIMIVQPRRRPIPVTPNRAAIKHMHTVSHRHRYSSFYCRVNGSPGIWHGHSNRSNGHRLNDLQSSASPASVTASRGSLARIRGAINQVIDVLVPPQCLRCGALVDTPGTLCTECWPRLQFIAAPLCIACGVPFEVDLGDEALCAECIRERPAYGSARAAIVYDENSRGLILAFKHGDRTDAAPAYGRWMARAGAEVLAGADALVPVPVHWTRLFARRYNQAALLAQAVGRTANLPVYPDVLLRRKRTPKLGTLGPSARRRVIKGAISIHTRRASLVADQQIVLVDDVHTTGSTIAECTRALLRAGAKGVDVLTLARTVRADIGGFRTVGDGLRRGR